MMMMSRPVVMVMSTTHVDVIGPSRQALQQQEDTKAGDEQTHAQPEPDLKGFPIHIGDEQQDDREHHDRPGVRDGCDQSEQHRVPDGATLTDEIRRHQRLAMPGREGMQRAEPGTGQHQQCEATFPVDEQDKRPESSWLRELVVGSGDVGAG